MGPLSVIHQQLRTLHVPKTSYYLPPYTIKLDQMCLHNTFNIQLYNNTYKVEIRLYIDVKTQSF